MSLQLFRDELASAIKGSRFENQVFIAGGAVRDMLMGRDSMDIDLCVSIDGGGILLAEYLCNLWKLPPAVIYKNFGTAKLEYKGFSVELVMTRSESYRPGNRNPKVKFGSLEQDVFRRDFTVNALLISVSSGELWDISKQGLDDLKAGLLRCVDDPIRVFMEDPLRILRAFRFSGQLGFEITADTLAGIKATIMHLKTISSARIADEMKKILMLDSYADTLQLMHECRALQILTPELYQNENKDFIDKIPPALAILKHLEKNSQISTKWAALLYHLHIVPNSSSHPHTKASTELQKILQSFDIALSTRQEIERKISDAKVLMHLEELPKPLQIYTLRRIGLETKDYVKSVFELLKALLHPLSEDANKRLEEYVSIVMDAKQEFVEHPFPISGEMIMQKFKINSSPLVGKLLNIVMDRWIVEPEKCIEELLEGLSQRIDL